MKIIVFGDSVADGERDEEGGWVQRLKRSIDAKRMPDSKANNIPVYNLSVSGDNTEGLLKRFDSEIRYLLDKDTPLTILFAIGLNDSAFFMNNNANWVSRKRFAENLKSLVAMAKKYTGQIIFIGLTPVDESKTTPIPWREELHYRNEYVKEYDAEIKKMCKENDILFIDIFGAFSKTNYKTLLEDGLHPNSQGHKKIFEIVKAYLIDKKILGKGG